MRWQRSCIKSDGRPRAQFLQWAVPADIRAARDLKDGDRCRITVSLGDFVHTAPYRLTSGGEFRMPKAVADSLRAHADGIRDPVVTFELMLEGILDEIADDFERQVRESLAITDEERRQRLSSARRTPERYQAQVTLFRRNPDVVAEVLRQAAGVCQQCTQPAPFHKSKDGSPYLEVHHKKRLSEGGEDTVTNAIALCPNCHRKNHYG